MNYLPTGVLISPVNLCNRAVQLLGVKHLLTSAYHPQCNAQAKRAILTLNGIVSHCLNKDKKNRDLLVPFATWSMNTTKQKTTGYSAFELVHGRRPVGPLDTAMSFQCWEEIQNPSEYFSLITDWLELPEKLRSSTSTGHMTIMHQGSILNAESLFLNLNKLVLEWRPANEQGLATKFLHCWKGLFLVLVQTNSVNVKFTHLKGKKKARVVHVERLKLYHTRKEEEDAVSVDTVSPLVDHSISAINRESFPEDDLPNLFREAEKASALFA